MYFPVKILCGGIVCLPRSFTVMSHVMCRRSCAREYQKFSRQLPFDVHDVGRATLVAATRGSIKAHLGFAYSSLAQFLGRIELALRDETQQLGTPGANCVLAHIKQALDVMIGDHRQPAGGSRPKLPLCDRPSGAKEMWP